MAGMGISVRGDTYARLKNEAGRRGLSVRTMVERAIAWCLLGEACPERVGHHRGHPIQFHDDEWRYADTMMLVSDDPDRPCGACGLPNRPDGHDACLGCIPGARNACCGHGIVADAYIQNEDGDIVRGRLAQIVVDVSARRGGIERFGNILMVYGARR